MRYHGIWYKTYYVKILLPKIVREKKGKKKWSVKSLKDTDPTALTQTIQAWLLP